MKIYISGPISNRSHEEAYQHFARWQARLELDGHEALNPFQVNQPPARTWAGAMRKDIKALLECDAILMLHGWSGSRGACLEQHIAEELELFMFEEETYDALSRR